ncbi:hypothetical protein BCR37DRAFT_377938 [Protomyces lactucae-debilis]|uniref:Putative ER transporter 6TM N-terminal domain-containing protein n=1 Tax=Protomyces lactucae-debilis TaxID=2754530 RepID=A0A1Y2FNS4_PROLT|nr:uncharacterized protein BCR37DRAFT_377938 [Protomyces lactucae-debilis]ORY84974.1 hypothetical protein BCR37DRAFT_377938 [Protomyces lactucae-debilis]
MGSTSSGSFVHAAAPKTSKAHQFFTSDKWTNIKIGFRLAAGVTIALCLPQNAKISGLFSTVGYVLGIFTLLFQIQATTRAAMVERVVLAGTFTGAIIPFCILGYFCAKSAKDPATTQQTLVAYVTAQQQGIVRGPDIFYQGRAAAVAAVFLFILTWAANVLKTLFIAQTFTIFGGVILAGIIFIEGWLFPSWDQFYSLLRQLIYAIYASLAIAFACNLLIFPYNAREAYLSQVDKFLSTAEQMTSCQTDHFSTAHRRSQAESEKVKDGASEGSHETKQPKKKGLAGLLGQREKPKPTQIEKLKGLRTALTGLATAIVQAKTPAKREFAYGHLKVNDLESLAKSCQSLVVPLFGLNLWSQISDLLHGDISAADDEVREAFIEAIGLENTDEVDKEELFRHMEDHVLPRFNRLTSLCSASILHIKQGLHLGPWKRPAFWLRPFIKSPAPHSGRDDNFTAEFEAEIKQFWASKSSSGSALHNGGEGNRRLLSIVYMDSTLYDLANKLLSFCKWIDSLHATGVMSKRHFIRPSVKRYKKALRKAWVGISQHANPPKDGLSRVKSGMLGADDSARSNESSDSASALFLNTGNPTLIPRTSLLSKVGMFFYRILKFLESPVSRFGFRAAIAMTVSALPVYFPDSCRAFLEYRLLWIVFTVLLGLQPVLGRGVFSSVLRVVATIIGGVLGLLCVEIGRVPGGILVVFFITLFPQCLLLMAQPQLMLLPVLLSAITGELVVGYYLTTVNLPRATLERSGQIVLGAPAIMGYRILLTLAGVVIALIFSVFPALPTGRTLLRDVTSQRFFTIADLYMLTSLRGAGNRYILPNGIEKAIGDLQKDGIGLSANAHQLVMMTKFEPSPRGTFPQGKWNELITLIDNLNTCLAVSNARFSDVLAAAPELEVSKLLLHSDSDKYFRVVTSILFALGNSYNLWQPLPPVLPSPMKAHLDTQKGMYKFRHIVAREAATDDAVAQFGAYLVTNAMMTHLLERILRLTGELIGVSGYKSYLQSHKRQHKD